MPVKPHLIEQASVTGDNSKAPKPEATLKEIVREALLAVLSDAGASAAAKASAGRTLMQFCDEKQRDTRRGADMSAAELNEAIERFKR